MLKVNNTRRYTGIIKPADMLLLCSIITCTHLKICHQIYRDRCCNDMNLFRVIGLCSLRWEELRASRYRLKSDLWSEIFISPLDFCRIISILPLLETIRCFRRELTHLLCSIRDNMCGKFPFCVLHFSCLCGSDNCLIGSESF